MANCPKCGEHLKLTDWKQHCPHCHCNIVVYDIQERLMQDADKAEVQRYYFQKKIDRMKASFVGSKLAVIRIFTSLIPLVAVVAPWLKGEFNVPFVEFKGLFTLFTLTDMLDSLDINSILNILNTDDGKIPIILLAVSLVLLLLSAVLLLVRFGCLTMACSKRGKIRNYTFDILTLVFCIVATVLLTVVPDNAYFNIDFVIAPFVYLLLLGVNFGVDIAVYKKGIEVKHEPCFVGGIPIEEYFKMVEDGVPQEEIRQEMYRRLTEMQLKKEAELNGEAVEK
ncbi:MAG: hypothetical protein J6B35_02680 [Clostridia bacterium]|nr:hypothetical protein [Clostridia bacterium]